MQLTKPGLKQDESLFSDNWTQEARGKHTTNIFVKNFKEIYMLILRKMAYFLMKDRAGEKEKSATVLSQF